MAENLPGETPAIVRSNDEWNAKAVDPVIEIIDSEKFAKRLGLPLTWVQNHTYRHCDDPIPHVKLSHYVRFE